jgi:hypothetical protein
MGFRIGIGLFVLGMLALFACVDTGYKQVIDVTRGQTIDDNLKIAQWLATQPHLALLKEYIEARLPGTTDEQLDGLALLWNDVRIRKSNRDFDRKITITLILRERRGVDAEEAMRIAAEWVEQQLSAAEAPAEKR